MMSVSDYTSLFEFTTENNVVRVDEYGIKFMKKGKDTFPTRALGVSRAMRESYRLLEPRMYGAITFQTAYALFIKNHPVVPDDIRERAAMMNKVDFHSILRDFYVEEAYNMGGYCTIPFEDLRYEMNRSAA